MPRDPAPSPRFFRSAADFRRWLEKNHATAREVWVGFYNQRSGKTGISYKEALDEALCLGWIDGVRKTVDDGRYTVRFTPRQPGSAWSVVNIARVEELRAGGRMGAAGLDAFAQRDEARSRAQSRERERATLGPELERIFRENARAWAFYEAQPPSYRRLTAFWVASAKKEETRLRRLQGLVDCSARGRRIPELERRGGAAAE
jgi:uncharacterized protein YdeI (YjbR/CyaY-like superfamily)